MATFGCPKCGTRFRGNLVDVSGKQCGACGASLVDVWGSPAKSGPTALLPHVDATVRGMAHPRSNIAAAYFDGPWLRQCLLLAVEVRKAVGDNHLGSWRD